MNTNIELAVLEILKMAKDLVINEYTERRAQTHNVWLVESQRLWQSQRIRLIYPPIPPYPTEIDILKKAKILVDFVYYQHIPDEIKSIAPKEDSPAIENTSMVDSPSVADLYMPQEVVQPIEEPVQQETQPITDAAVKEELPAKEEVNGIFKRIEGLLKGKPK